MKILTPFTKPIGLSLSWARSSLYYALPTDLFRIYLNFLFPFAPSYSKWTLSFRFPTKNLRAPSLGSIRATYPANPILLDLAIRKTFDQKYKSQSSLFSFLQSPVPRPSYAFNHTYIRYLAGICRYITIFIRAEVSSRSITHFKFFYVSTLFSNILLISVCFKLINSIFQIYFFFPRNVYQFHALQSLDHLF